MKRYIYFFLIFGFNIIHFVLITFEKETQCTMYISIQRTWDPNVWLVLK